MSSWVATGHVGLSAATPVLQALGCETLQLPTVVISNHNAWPYVGGRAIAPEHLREMVDAIEANGWLGSVDALLTGYAPTAAHIDLTVEIVERLRRANPDAAFVCDPVLGDDPKGLYVKEDVATGIRDRLAPIADVLTPNRFELSWLSGATVDTAAGAAKAAHCLPAGRPGRRILVTSAPVSTTETGVIEAAGGAARLYRARRREGVPNGVGDVFAALVAGGETVAAALGRLDKLIAASIGAPHLAVMDPRWKDAAAIAGDAI